MSVRLETRDLAGSPFRIGGWLVEPSLNRLSKGDTIVQLELKVMDVLVCLAERGGEVLTRQEIIDRVWATEFISDNTLTHAITELRNALGDDARNPSFIETIHRRGYRLIAPVEPVVSDEAGESKAARFPVPERPDERSPYPGLAAFTEDDAEFFFGREEEVAKMWRKLTSRKLLAIIGPSGVGKSSFLRAGVIPAAPEGWGVLVCQPGEAPFAALARALVPEFAGDIEATAQLVDIRDGDRAVAMVSRWRDRYGQALLILDQFEELFTLNPSDTQTVFSEFLRGLVDDAEVHVLLAMRDDFLYKCHRYEPLQPIFDALMPLEQPNADSLRLALVEPARRLGFSFENEGLPGEMIAEVEGERGALPMLAFAVARLWEERDRERKLLTDRAYEEIGGVGGALGQHAETTLKSIGDDRVPIVREIFRNLVTAEGTRAVREWSELLSVFPGSRRTDADTVLRRLVDSRLLTTFEEEEIEGDGRRRVEVVNESLLPSWPRLVRWQTQDQEGAQLREELRQAARTWDEHNRSDDLLWTGSAYREYSVWRERYPGGLTETEEAFGAGMTTLVTRRRRRRRIGIAAGFVVLLAGLAVVASFWRQSVRETRRAEAAELVAVGQLELEGYPTASVAHAIASLELFDSPAARILALEALWMGPTAMVINDEWTIQTVFTSDGKWLIQSRTATGTAPLRVIGADGSSEVLEYIQGGAATIVEAGVESGYFGLRGWDKDNTQDVEALWSAPERKRLAEVRYDRRTVGAVVIRSDQRRMLMTVHRKEERVAVDAIGFDGSRRSLGTINLDAETEDGELRVNMNAAGRYLAASTGHDIYVIAIEENGLSEPRLLGRQETPVTAVDMDERDRFVAAVDKDCRIGLWFLDDVRPPALIQGPPGGCGLHSPWDAGDVLVTLRSLMPPSDPGYWVWSLESGEPRLLRTFDFDREAIGSVRFWLNADYFVRAGPDQKIRLWALAGPPDAEPLTLLRGEVGQFWFAQFHPNGKWLVSPDESGLSMWPLARPYPTVFRGHGGQVNGVVAGPGGRWLASSSDDGSVRIWPLEGDPPAAGSAAYESDVPLEQMYGLSRSIDGAFLLVGNNRGGPRLLSTTGGESTVLEDAPENQIEGSTSPYGDTAFSVDGRFVAASSAIPEAALRRIGVWDVGTGEQIRVLAKGEARMYGSPQFLDDGSLIALDHSGVRRWNLETGENELVYAGTFHRCAIGRDQNRLLLLEARTHNDTGRAVIFDIESGVATPLESHGHRVQSVALDPSGSFAVTGDRDGVVRVGPVSGEEPHLLIGHENRVDAVAVDPESRWVASGGKDYSVRVWPMPDLSKPPLHTLPRDELIAKLKTLTNLRVVRDEESSTGWKLTHDPFPGWETVPTW